MKNHQVLRHWSYLVAIISPASEFHFAPLVVEGKPGDVDLAGALEDAWWYVDAGAVVSYHHVRWVRAVEAFVGTTNKEVGTLFMDSVGFNNTWNSKLDWRKILFRLFLG